MAPRTHYDVLLVSPRADGEIITAAYRVLAKRYHPDRHPGLDTEARMAEINAAYHVLRDPEHRARYDEQAGLALARIPVGEPTPDRAAPPAPRQEATPRHERMGATAYGEAGPPPRYPPARGTVLTFGRYQGWTIPQVEHYDRTYLEWLVRTPGGRVYQRELEGILASAAT